MISEWLCEAARVEAGELTQGSRAWLFFPARTTGHQLGLDRGGVQETAVTVAPAGTQGEEETVMGNDTLQPAFRRTCSQGLRQCCAQQTLRDWKTSLPVCGGRGSDHAAVLGLRCMGITRNLRKHSRPGPASLIGLGVPVWQERSPQVTFHAAKAQNLLGWSP